MQIPGGLTSVTQVRITGPRLWVFNQLPSDSSVSNDLRLQGFPSYMELGCSPPLTPCSVYSRLNINVYGMWPAPYQENPVLPRVVLVLPSLFLGSPDFVAQARLKATNPQS